MPVSKAQQKATTKYESLNYDKVLLRLSPKGKHNLIKSHAESRGLSLNSYINKLIDGDMEK